MRGRRCPKALASPESERVCPKGCVNRNKSQPCSSREEGWKRGWNAQNPLCFSQGSIQKRELLASTAGDALDADSFADAFLNGFEFSLGTLNDWPFEPEARADKPPDRDKQDHAQHHYRRIVKVTRSNGCGRRQHKQHRDEDNPYHSDPANRPAPGSQVPWSSLEVR